MTQKYFELLEVCKQISPETKETIEELKFGTYFLLNCSICRYSDIYEVVDETHK
jgi:hypothetical protein